VSKTVAPERIREAVESGVHILGENYLQEAQGKIEVLGRGYRGILSAICRRTRQNTPSASLT